jgi:hypothetical protein
MSTKPIKLYSHAGVSRDTNILPVPFHLTRENQGPNPWKVAIILNELNIPYESELMDFTNLHKGPPSHPKNTFQTHQPTPFLTSQTLTNRTLRIHKPQRPRPRHRRPKHLPHPLGIRRHNRIPARHLRHLPESFIHLFS